MRRTLLRRYLYHVNTWSEYTRTSAPDQWISRCSIDLSERARTFYMWHYKIPNLLFQVEDMKKRKQIIYIKLLGDKLSHKETRIVIPFKQLYYTLGYISSAFLQSCVNLRRSTHSIA